jgi:cobalt-zinc-cadmium efflux system membrane fusion protein
MSMPRFHSSSLVSTPTIINHSTIVFLGLLLVVIPIKLVLAHGGHGNEFKQDSGPVSGSVQVDPAMATRLGIKIEPVSRQHLSFGIKATGQIEALPNQKVEVTTPVGGTITQLLVKPGDRVTVGQEIAIMSARDLVELRTTALDRQNDALGQLQEADTNLQLARQNNEQQKTIAESEIQQATSEVNLAREIAQKDKQLATQGALPKRTALESATKLTLAKSVLTKAESRLSVLESNAQLKRAESAVTIAQMKASLSGQTYQARLKQLGASANADGTVTIKAPIAGMIADLDLSVGESNQDAGRKVLSIVNQSTVQLTANIFEKDLDKIKIGQRIQAKVASVPNQIFAGELNLINPTVSGENRVVPVKATIENPGEVLKPGMFAELEVLTDRTPIAVLVIPKSAIVETNDKKKIVFVQNGNAFQSTEVTLGRESGEFIEIKDGVFDGDKVVTQRAPQLYAQSLRGMAAPASEKETGSTPTNNMLPGWLLPAGGVAIATTFGIGILAGRKFVRPIVPLNESEPLPPNTNQ